VFRTPEDDLVFLEIAARSPGALVPEMCERRTGIHLLEANLKLQMGSAEQLEMSPGPFSGWAWFPCRPGTVAATNELDLSCHHRVTWHARPGTRCEKDGIAIACEILFWHEDQRVLQRDAEYLRHWQPTVSET
jgi:biotin carboxylase